MAPYGSPGSDALEQASVLSEHIHQLTGSLQLAEVKVGASPALSILYRVQGIKTQALPELMATGPAHFNDGFLLKKIQAPLEIFDLSN